MTDELKTQVISVDDIPKPGLTQWERKIEELYKLPETQGLVIDAGEGKPKGIHVQLAKAAKAMKRRIEVTIEGQMIYLQRGKTKYKSRAKKKNATPPGG